MKHTITKITILLTTLISISLNAQDTKVGHVSTHKKNILNLAIYKQPGLDSMVDFVDGLYRVFKVNKLRSQDDKQNKTLFTFIPAVEYSLATGFASSLNANFILPVKKMTDNHSFISSELKYTQKKQAIAQIVSNVWLKNNEYNINTNWSYLKFPQKDFGLESSSDLKLFDNLEYSYIKLHQSIVKRIAPNLYFGPGLNIDYRWNCKSSA
jgi:hypothetical protein